MLRQIFYCHNFLLKNKIYCKRNLLLFGYADEKNCERPHKALTNYLTWDIELPKKKIDQT